MKKLFFLFALAGTLAFSQTQVAPIVNPHIQLFNAGVPCSGCLLSTFSAGTTNALVTYSESTGTTPNANPIQLDASGQAVIYLTSASYKFVLKTAAGVSIWTQDNISWATPLTTFTGITSTANSVIKPATAATSGANQSSPTLCLDGFYFNISSLTDQWCLQTVLGTGTAPTTTLNVTHSGSGGTATVNLPNLTFSNFSACIENGMYVAGTSCYATIAAARTAAGINTVLIPSTYAGTDTVADGNNPVIDLRNNVFKASHFFGCAYPMTNAPGGLDCSYEANGAGDLYLTHNTHINPVTTTSSSLTVGANTNILVGSTALFGTGGTAPLIVGRDTPNAESIGTGNWSIVDSTHLSITAAKAHTSGAANNNSQTNIDIEQLGVTHFDPGLFLAVVSHKPASLSGRTSPAIWLETTSSPFLVTPGSTADAFPFNAIAVGVPITAFTPSPLPIGPSFNPANLQLRNADSSHDVRFENSLGANQFNCPDGSCNFSIPLVDATAGAVVAASGAIRFQNAHGIAWRNVANSADLSFGVNAADGVAFNAAAVVGTIPYNVGVANLTAQSAAVGPTTIRAVAANQAGMFRISWAAVVTQAATTSSTLGGATTGFQVTYTDNDTGATVTTPLAAAPGASTNTAYSQTNSQNTVGAQASGVVIVNAKASTNIQYNFGYTSVGATVMQYALHIRIEPI